MAKPTRASIKKKLVYMAKEIAKSRDKYTCQKCRKVLYLRNCQGSHVIPVSANLLLSFDPENIIVLCLHCHIYWWHKNPLEAGEWFKKTFPKRWKYLELMQIQPRKSIKTWELIDMLDSLEKYREKQENKAIRGWAYDNQKT